MGDNALAMNGKLHEMGCLVPTGYEWNQDGTNPEYVNQKKPPQTDPLLQKSDLPNLLAAAGILTRVR